MTRVFGVDDDLQRVRRYIEETGLSNEAVRRIAGIESATTAAQIGRPDFNPTLATIRRLCAMVPPDWRPAGDRSPRETARRRTASDTSSSVVLGLDPACLPLLDRSLARARAFLDAARDGTGLLREAAFRLADLRDLVPMASIHLFAWDADPARSLVLRWDAPPDFDGGTDYTGATVLDSTPDPAIRDCFLADLAAAVADPAPQLAVLHRRRTMWAPSGPWVKSYVFARLMARIEGVDGAPKVVVASRRKEARAMLQLFPHLRGGRPDQDDLHP